MAKSRKRRNQEKRFFTAAMYGSPLTVSYIYEQETQSWGAMVSHHNTLVEFLLEETLPELFTAIQTFLHSEYAHMNPNHVIDRNAVPADKQTEIAVFLQQRSL